MRSDTTADWNGSTIETPLFVDAPEVLLSVQELLGKKWHPVIVYELLENGPMGFSALKKSVDGISSKMLIQAANAVAGVRDARKFHVDAALDGVDSRPWSTRWTTSSPGSPTGWNNATARRRR